MDNDEYYYEEIEAPKVDRVAEVRKKRWERKRKWAEGKSAIISVLVLGGMLLLISLFLLVFPRSTVSEVEKRTLTPFPSFSLSSYFSGDFFAGIASHYDDTVPYRDSFKNLGNQFKSLFGFRSGSENAVTFINKAIVAEAEGAQTTKTEETPEEETTNTAKPEKATEETPVEPLEEEEPAQKDFTQEEADFNLSNGLLVVYQNDHWKCLPLFGGGSGDAYVESLNTLRQKVGSSVKIYSMPCPLSSQYYVPSNAADYSSDQSKCFDDIAAKMDTGITSINVCDTLAKHTEEEIFCRTDHHWQALGAYYACEQFAKTAGVPFADISQYTRGVNEGYVGTMYAFSEDSRILNDPEDFVYYVPKAEYDGYFYDTAFNYHFKDDLFFDVSTASSYLMFLGSDEYVVKVKTKVKNNRRLLVIKDSYGNAEIPFLTSSFEEIYVADVRYFERNLPNFIKTMNVTDVLFTMCSYSVVGDNGANIMNLITQDADSVIEDKQPEMSAAYAAQHPEEAQTE